MLRLYTPADVAKLLKRDPSVMHYYRTRYAATVPKPHSWGKARNQHTVPLYDARGLAEWQTWQTRFTKGEFS